MKLAPSRIRTNSDEFEACQHVWPPHRPAQPSLAFHWAALVGPTLGLLGTPTFMGGEVSSGPVGVRQCNCTYGGGDGINNNNNILFDAPMILPTLPFCTKIHVLSWFFSVIVL